MLESFSRQDLSAQAICRREAINIEVVKEREKLRTGQNYKLLQLYETHLNTAVSQHEGLRILSLLTRASLEARVKLVIKRRK